MKSFDIKSFIIKNMPYVSFVLVVSLFAILTQGQLITSNNLMLILEQSFILLIMCSGVLFVISMGCLDFSQGSILALACYVGAVVAQTSLVGAIFASVLTGTVLGAINGVLHGVVKIPAFIATISTQFIFRGLVTYFTRKGAVQMPFEILKFNTLSYKIPILVIILLVTYVLYRYTKFGRHCKAIGAGAIGAKYSGVNVIKVKVLAFTLAGTLAGCAAYLNLIRTGTATANTGTLLETNIMIALVLGGLPISGGARCKYASVVLGGILLNVLTNGLVQLGVGIVEQQLIKGIVFVVMIALSVERKNGIIIK